MDEIFLRPYQESFIDDVRNEFRLNHKRVVGVAPCGAGKNKPAAALIKCAQLSERQKFLSASD